MPTVETKVVSQDVSRILADETVCVIGAGISGCLLAYELRNVGYGEVLLFEAKDQICQSATGVVSELHSGAEYPFDAQTGRDCLRGLVEFRKVFPEETFRKPRTQFLISKNTAKQGLTADVYASHCSLLKDEYAQIIRESPSSEMILGPIEDFWRRLPPSEYSDVLNVASGFETPQHGVEPDLLVGHLRRLLDQSSVQVRLLHTVNAVRRRGKDFHLRVNAAADTEQTVQCSQVAFADHFSGLSLIHAVADTGFKLPTVYAALRLIVLAKHGTEQPFPRPSRFMLEGKDGAMDGPIAPQFSLVYQPTFSQIEKRVMDNSYRIPPNWKDRILRPNRDDLERAAMLIREASRLAYPYLSSSTVDAAYLRIALNTVKDSRKRRNPGILVPCHDCVSLALTTKATCAALNAKRAAQQLVQHALSRRGVA